MFTKYLWGSINSSKVKIRVISSRLQNITQKTLCRNTCYEFSYFTTQFYNVKDAFIYRCINNSFFTISKLLQAKPSKQMRTLKTLQSFVQVAFLLLLLFLLVAFSGRTGKGFLSNFCQLFLQTCVTKIGVLHWTSRLIIVSTS